MESSSLRNWAEALHEEAQAAGQVAEVLESLELIARAVWVTPEFQEVAAHPGIAPGDKVRLVQEALQGAAPPLVERFLALLFARRRFRELPRLLELLHEILQEHEGRKVVRVESSAALSAVQKERLEQALEKLLGRPVRVQEQFVPELLGGLRIRVDSQVLDASLAGRLERMEAFLQENPWPDSGEQAERRN